jgi:hypothetical protein
MGRGDEDFNGGEMSATNLQVINGTQSLVDQDPVVSRLVRAHSMLAEANTVQKAKSFVDAAITAEVYIKRQKLGEETENLALLIKVDALKNLGEVLAETPRAKARFNEGNKMEPSLNEAPTLAELGLDKKTSSIAQRLAALPDAELEDVRSGNITIAKAIAAADTVKAKHTVKPEPQSVTEPEPEYSELDAARDQITELQDALAIANLSDADIAATHITEMRSEIKTLKAMLKSVTAMRDSYQAENVELKNQIRRQRKEIDKLAGTKTA